MRIFIITSSNGKHHSAINMLLKQLPGYDYLQQPDMTLMPTNTFGMREYNPHHFARLIRDHSNAIVVLEDTDETWLTSLLGKLNQYLNTTCGILVQLTDNGSQPQLQHDCTLSTALRTHIKPLIWQEYRLHYAFSDNDWLNQIHYQHHRLIETLFDMASQHDEISAMVLYGSTGANQLSKNSDIDCFIETTFSIQLVQHLLQAQLNKEVIHCDRLNNKLTFRTRDSLLLEVICGNNIDSIAVYYRESCIANVYSTVLKNRPELIAQLTEYLQQPILAKDKALSIAAELFFLFCSLPHLIEAEDCYKYGFHTNIMLHYAVQLEHLLRGNLAHNYLPKQAKNQLPNFPWEVFTINYRQIDRKQYQDVYQYLQQLYYRLTQAELIEQGHYFQPHAKQLHTLPPCHH